MMKPSPTPRPTKTYLPEPPSRAPKTNPTLIPTQGRSMPKEETRNARSQSKIQKTFRVIPASGTTTGPSTYTRNQSAKRPPSQMKLTLMESPFFSRTNGTELTKIQAANLEIMNFLSPDTSTSSIEKETKNHKITLKVNKIFPHSVALSVCSKLRTTATLKKNTFHSIHITFEA